MIKVIIIAILAAAALGFMGATIGLAVTRNKVSGTSTSPDPEPTPACINTEGYFFAFNDNKDIAEQYIIYTEKDDQALLEDMMEDGEPFTNGKAEFAKQANILEGTIALNAHIGKDCKSPDPLPAKILDRYKLADSYSKMTYEEFLESQGIYS